VQIARELARHGLRRALARRYHRGGKPRQTREILELFLRDFPPSMLALHMHDTHGRLAQLSRRMDLGVTTFDTSIGGLGGALCAGGRETWHRRPGLDARRHGIETAWNLDKLIQAGRLAQELVGRKLPGRRLQAALDGGSPERRGRRPGDVVMANLLVEDRGRFAS